MSFNPTLAAVCGFSCGLLVSIHKPLPPLFAFACAALDMPAAVLMDDTLVCLKDAKIMRSDDILSEILDGIRERRGQQ